MYHRLLHSIMKIYKISLLKQLKMDMVVTRLKNRKRIKVGLDVNVAELNINVVGLATM